MRAVAGAVGRRGTGEVGYLTVRAAGLPFAKLGVDDADDPESGLMWPAGDPPAVRRQGAGDRFDWRGRGPHSSSSHGRRHDVRRCHRRDARRTRSHDKHGKYDRQHPAGRTPFPVVGLGRLRTQSRANIHDHGSVARWQNSAGFHATSGGGCPYRGVGTYRCWMGQAVKPERSGPSGSAVVCVVVWPDE